MESIFELLVAILYLVKLTVDDEITIVCYYRSLGKKIMNTMCEYGKRQRSESLTWQNTYYDLCLSHKETKTEFLPP